LKIECTIRRDTTINSPDGRTERVIGSKVQLDNDDGTVEYHFKPEAGGDKHVCEVENEDHAAIFLKITEAYAPADEDSKALAELVKPKALPAEYVPETASVKAFTEEELQALKFPELKKMLVERYGKQLPVSAKKEDFITALLNAQGM
jgi:hypothetical protein